MSCGLVAACNQAPPPKPALLSEAEIAAYVATGDWQGKAGAYGIQGPAGAFVRRIVGSHPAVMGLPLYETVSLLEGVGYRRG